jgi:hypothetical protein
MDCCVTSKAEHFTRMDVYTASTAKYLTLSVQRVAFFIASGVGS